MNIIFIAIIFLIFGVAIGMVIELFVASVGRNNQAHDYYQEGFIDGYTKAKEEIK